jgi:hypothetical protein
MATIQMTAIILIANDSVEASVIENSRPSGRNNFPFKLFVLSGLNFTKKYSQTFKSSLS